MDLLQYLEQIEKIAEPEQIEYTPFLMLDAMKGLSAIECEEVNKHLPPAVYVEAKGGYAFEGRLVKLYVHKEEVLSEYCKERRGNRYGLHAETTLGETHCLSVSHYIQLLRMLDVALEDAEREREERNKKENRKAAKIYEKRISGFKRVIEYLLG